MIHLLSLSQWLWWHMSLEQNICWITWRHFCQFIYTSFGAILLLVGLMGVEQPGHDIHSPPSSTKVKMRRAIPLLPLNAFMAWTGMSFTWRRFLMYNWFTYSMVQSPSWEANWSAASQETPRISRNPKVHYRPHKRPPPVSILGQPNPVHIPTSHLLEIRSNIIRPSTSRSPQWLLPSGFPTKTLYTSSPHPYALHAQPISSFEMKHKLIWS